MPVVFRTVSAGAFDKLEDLDTAQHWADALALDVGQEVLPGLWLGGVDCAHNAAFLAEHGITHILTVGDQLPPRFPDRFVYKVLEVPDCPSTNLVTHFPACLGFIRSALSEAIGPAGGGADEGGGGTGGVLVHCYAGRSRSATVVIAYLMCYEELEYEEALQRVLDVRPFVAPNEGFVRQLQTWQEVLPEARRNLLLLRRQAAVTPFDFAIYAWRRPRHALSLMFGDSASEVLASRPSALLCTAIVMATMSVVALAQRGW